MEKAILATILCLLVVPLALAQGPPANPGSGADNSPIDDTPANSVSSNESEDSNNSETPQETPGKEGNTQGKGDNKSEEKGHMPERVREKIQNKSQKLEQVEQKVQQKMRKIDQKLENLTGQKKAIHRRQNKVRESVHTLLQLKKQGMIQGGIGKNVSRIARNFSNSVNETIQAETEIENGSRFRRFFLGASKEDQRAARNLTQNRERNRKRIQELNQIKEQCNCSNETKEVMEAEIQDIEKEQKRLKKIADKGKSRGLFGWIVR